MGVKARVHVGQGWQQQGYPGEAPRLGSVGHRGRSLDKGPLLRDRVWRPLEAPGGRGETLSVWSQV